MGSGRDHQPACKGREGKNATKEGKSAATEEVKGLRIWGELLSLWKMRKPPNCLRMKIEDNIIGLQQADGNF